MEAIFDCENISCSFPGEGQFKMKLNFESIMDQNNVATVFCPFCKEPMVASCPMPASALTTTADTKGVNPPSQRNFNTVGIASAQQSPQAVKTDDLLVILRSCAGKVGLVGQNHLDTFLQLSKCNRTTFHPYSLQAGLSNDGPVFFSIYNTVLKIV